jgi:putative Holliday junction resolvase
LNCFNILYFTKKNFSEPFWTDKIHGWVNLQFQRKITFKITQLVACNLNHHNIPMPMQIKKRILALDYGKSRIGVAISDDTASIALPLCVLPQINRDKDLKAIKELILEHNVALIVMGLPRRSEHELGPAAEHIVRFGKRLARFCGVPLEFIDEFETTMEAEEVLLQADVSRQKRRKSVDKLAAQVILKRYLDNQKEPEA